MIKLSLWLNIVVLLPVCSGIMGNANWTAITYGNPTPARGILLSVYLAILLFSMLLLLKPDPKMVAALLLVQIIYKCSTPFTVGTFSNSVVISNLCIAVFHGITVFMLWKSGLLLD